MTDNTSNRGFASMDEEKQKEIASKGGQYRAKKTTLAILPMTKRRQSKPAKKADRSASRAQKIPTNNLILAKKMHSKRSAFLRHDKRPLSWPVLGISQGFGFTSRFCSDA